MSELQLNTGPESKRIEPWSVSVQDVRDAMVPFDDGSVPISLDSSSSEEWSRLASMRGGLIHALSSPETTATEAAEALEVLRDYMVIKNGLHPNIDLSPFEYAEWLRSNVKAGIYKEVFEAEQPDGILHQAISGSFAWATESGRAVAVCIDQLKDAYGLPNATAILDENDVYSAEIQDLLLHPNAVHSTRRDYYDSTHGKAALAKLEYADFKEASREWLGDVISKISGLSSDEAKRYTYNCTRIGDDLAQIRVLDRIREFGAERIRAITAFSGIEALNNYTSEQLKRVERLANDDADEIARLQKHDVIVTMTNSVGEYGSATNNTAEITDDETGRVVPFEIRSMIDIYRYMGKLKRLGIKPSILHLSAHSSKGEFLVSDKRETGEKRYDAATVLGRVVTSLRVLDQGVSVDNFFIDESKGVARLVDEYMQPSKGADTSDIGKKKIVFQACYAGYEVNEATADDGSVVHVGGKSVISQIAEQLRKNGSESTVELYGSVDPIQMERTENGVAYSGKMTGFDVDRPRTSAVRVSYGEGEIVKDSVEEIIYR